MTDANPRRSVPASTRAPDGRVRRSTRKLPYVDLRALWKEMGSLKAVGDAYGCSKVAVWQAIRADDAWEARKAGDKRPIRSGLPKATVLRREWARLGSLEAVADRHRVSPETVKRALTRAMREERV